MSQLIGKRILLGVTGSIVAYKAAVLLRLLREQGAEVRVVMTKNACEFVSPLTFQALSGRRVYTDLMDLEVDSAMRHIELARWMDLILIAPASANFIARYAHGFADDLLSSVCLSGSVPVMIAPAMNQQMWLNSATQENIRTIEHWETRILGPTIGDQACGDTGPGRMLEPDTIVTHIAESFESDILSGFRLLVTAGPTHEAIDPVRYIGNRSSGRMGYAIAKVAREAGAKVSLVSGPVHLASPEKVHVINVISAAEMYSTVMQSISDTDIFISVAAVADYGLESVAEQKIKKTRDSFELVLRRNPDILAAVAALQNGPFTVGFAAETENLERNAKTKLQTKKLDMIVANQVGNGLGFDSEMNALSVFWNNGHVHIPQAPKEKLARNLIRLIMEKYNEKTSNQSH